MSIAATGTMNVCFLSRYTPPNRARAVMGTKFGGCGSKRLRAARPIRANVKTYRIMTSPQNMVRIWLLDNTKVFAFAQLARISLILLERKFRPGESGSRHFYLESERTGE